MPVSWSISLCLALAACSPSPAPLHTCADPLAGLWSTGSTTPAATWHLLDDGAELQGFPIYHDLPAEPPGALAAPALLTLRRHDRTISGTISRRWQLGAATCVVRSAAAIRGCAADRLALQLGPTGAPTDWSTCAPSGTATTQLLRRAWP